MNIGLKLSISILLLASIGVVVGNHFGYPADLDLSTPSLQIDQSSSNGNLISAGNLASGERVFVGSIKSDKYHYPWCSAAQRIKPENEIWFSSSEDARAHGYVPCKICHPP